MQLKWCILGVFALQNFASSLPIFVFAPIQKAASENFSVSTDIVNLLSVLALAAYAPGTLLGQICSLGFGLRHSVLIGTVITLLGVVISTVGLKFFAAVIVGQILCGLAQPFVVNSSSKFASYWFDEESRDIATSLASMASPLGNAVSQIISSLTVGEEIEHGIQNVMYILLGISSLSAIFVYFFLKSNPDSPPSISNEEMIIFEQQYRFDV
jgi:FLVCR family MFS transporter 7